MHPPTAALLLSLSWLASCLRDEVAPSGRAPAVTETTTATSAVAQPPSAPNTPRRDEPEPPMPSPARRRLMAAVAENAACESCHDEEAKEWRGSYHQRANVDPAYRTAFAIEPTPFCRSCHAPEANPLEEPSDAVSALGVACVTCHVTEEGFVLTAARHADEAEPEHANAPHPLRRSYAFAHAGGCAGCHEFRFPIPGGNGDAFFMQTTAREHGRSPGASKPCADCHMPTIRGRRSHAFAQVRDPAFLRENLASRAERTEDDTLRVTLVQPNPGHDFPTGDLFRRLEVGYALLSEDGRILRREKRHLARHFEIFPGQAGRHLVADDRVTSEPRVVEMDLPPRNAAFAAARIEWWVTYQRVATVGKGTNPADAIIESQVELHSGSLAWNTQTQFTSVEKP